MRLNKGKNGFSLTEVLMAVGILSIGMMLIATMFPVGIYLTGVGAERTMASLVADEAFAKIQLYGLDFGSASLPSFNNSRDYNDISNPIDPVEFSYPSVDPCSTANSQYYWSALCRQTDPNDPNEFQVTVFVARKTSASHTYPHPFYLTTSSVDRPRPIAIDCNLPADANELTILGGNERYVNPPTAIVDNFNGEIYRVINREGATVRLERPWEDGAGTYTIWLIPPPNTGGKNADIEVYQRIIRF